MTIKMSEVHMKHLEPRLLQSTLENSYCCSHCYLFQIMGLRISFEDFHFLVLSIISQMGIIMQLVVE